MKTTRVRNRPVELIKSLLIAFLVLSMSYLFLRTWMYDLAGMPPAVSAFFERFYGFFGVKTTDSVVQVEGSRAEFYGQAVIPVRCAVTLDGGRFGAEFGDPTVEMMYGGLGSVISEAIGSALAPEKISREAFFLALCKNGVYFEYSDPAPLALIGLSLGVKSELSGDIAADRLVLVAEGEAIVIYGACGTSEFFRAATSAPSYEVTREGERYEPNGCEFSFENEAVAPLGREFMLIGQPFTVDVITAQDIQRTDTVYSAILDAFGINPLTNYRYTSNAGAQSAVEEKRSLTLTADNEIIYSDSGAENHSLEVRPGAFAAIESTRRIAETTAGALAGEARISLRGVTEEVDGYTVSYGYVVAGAPVFVAGTESSIVFRITDGYISSARLVLRRYAVTFEENEQKNTVLMPLESSATLAGGENTALGVGYYDDGNGELFPQWYARKEDGG